MQTFSRAVLAMSLTVALAGCGPELVGAGQGEGEVRTVVTSEEGASPSRMPADGPGVSYSLSGSESSAEARGTVTYEAAVSLISDSGTEVRLTSGVVPGTFRIEGADSSLVGQRAVRARTYTRARITFTRVEANVTGGVTLPGGVGLTGTVRVDLGSGGNVVVEAPIQLTVQENQSHQLVVDLNAHTWLVTANPATRVVATTAFRSAVEVRTR